MSNRRETLEEFRIALSDDEAILESVIPPLLFLLADTWFGFRVAMWISFSCGAVITLARAARKQKIWYALRGVSVVLLTIGLRYLLQRHWHLHVRPAKHTTTMARADARISAFRKVFAYVYFI